jgi:hypothetical protein
MVKMLLAKMHSYYTKEEHYFLLRSRLKIILTFTASIKSEKKEK